MLTLLTTADVAEILASSPRTVRRWCSTGRLPHLVTPTGRIRIRPEAVVAFLHTPADRTPDSGHQAA